MEIINSAQNQKLKLLKSLSQKKFREASGLYLVEGANILRDMPEGVEAAFFAVDAEKAHAFSDITDRFDSEVHLVQGGVLDAVCGTATPQGIIAAIFKPALEFALPKANALVLDGISDAGNLGTIIRTAAAADFLDIYLLGCADAYSPKAVRASMGGIFKTRCMEVNEEQAKSVLNSTNSFALDMRGAPISQTKLSPPLTLLCGSEAHGIRDGLRSMSKETISIAMKNGMESLNAAVALSIAMYNAIS